MRKLIISAFIAVAGFTTITTHADTGHVIVAFDNKVDKNYQSSYREPQILSMIDNIIQKNLQHDEMYVSAVGYTMDGANPDIDKFVLPYMTGNGEPLIWERYSSLSKMFPRWPNGEPRAVYSYAQPGSMQSLAKPYCVMETAVSDDGPAADATYVLFVTDEKNQGVDDDYAGEWQKMWYYNPKAFDRIHDKVFGKLREFNETYRFQFRDRKPIDGKYSIVCYEVIPASQPSIYSVSDMPTPLPIKRVRGGYRIDCKVGSNDPKYKIRDWKIIGPDGNAFEQDGNGNIFIRSGALKEGDPIEITMDLQLTDGLYNGAVLNKDNCAGMTLKQDVKLNDEHKIWGLVPLADFFWWWYPNDVETAVKIWESVILVFFVVLIFYIFRTLSKHLRCYKPSNKNISMNIKTSK